MLITLACAAMTVIFFIVSQVSDKTQLCLRTSASDSLAANNVGSLAVQTRHLYYKQI